MNKKLKDYDLQQYENDIKSFGLNKTWEYLLTDYVKTDELPFCLKPENLGELYEIGLAIENKTSKKEHGKYYTPSDVAELMSNWLLDLKGTNVCDVCCGTGNLVLKYLELLGDKKAIKLIKNGHLFLYDMDELALKICVALISKKYGIDCAEYINIVSGDFLNKDIILPENAKVISNPPYFKIEKIEQYWGPSTVINDSREFYSAIMEKIIRQSKSSVVITPYSFIGGKKFSSLRQVMDEHNGFVVSFDNVPGNIFNGRKHGIFNSNSSNSVRAAITVTENKGNYKGYRTSPLIRFKSEERSNILKPEFLDNFISDKYQRSQNGEPFYKCSRDLQPLLTEWMEQSNKTLSDYLVENSDFTLTVPNSCRYYTVAAKKDLDRTGKYRLCFKTFEDMCLTYCFINSSFAYWHWRLYDGGITYPIGLLKSMPVFYDIIVQEQKDELIELAKEMMDSENQYLSYKKNAGKDQESIKFDKQYRIKINQILSSTLAETTYDLEVLHSNKVMEE